MKLIYQTPIIKFTVRDAHIIDAANDWFIDLSQDEYDAIADYFGRESFDKLNTLFNSFAEFMGNNLEEEDTDE